MDAKQTLLSASLVVLVPAATALADPEDADPQPADQAPAPPSDGKSGTFSVGAGYGTDDGFILGARVEQPNLFRTGKALSLSAIVTERQQRFVLRYDDPALFGSDTLRLRGDLYSERKSHTGFDRVATGGSLSLVQRIAPNLDVYAGYKLETVEVTQTDTVFRSAQPFWRSGLVSALRVGINYSTISPMNRYYPMRGTTVGAQIERADREVGSEINYTRTDAWLAHHRPLGPFTLHLGARASSISTDVPMSERLHFDGSSDIRGYAPDSLLPGGGNFMWTARAELEAPLIPAAQLNVAGFFDAGGLYRPGIAREAASAGFGVIWRSPIGPLRFDYAIPLDGGEPRFLVGIGGVF
jgi:outer membrane protein insertion porin family